MNIKEKITTAIVVSVLIIFVIGFVLGVYFFGMVGVFKLLGVQYESTWSLVIFVISFVLLSLIVELFSNVLFKLSVQTMTEKIKIFLIRLSYGIISNWLVLFIVDEFMNSITLSLKTEIIIAIFLGIIEIAFDDEKDRSLYSK